MFSFQNLQRSLLSKAKHNAVKARKHLTVKDIIAFAAFVLLAVYAWHLRVKADTALISKSSAFYILEALAVALIGTCFLGTAPVLRFSRFLALRILAALPMGTLIFAGVWIVSYLLVHVIYDSQDNDFPSSHQTVWYYGTVFISLTVGLAVIVREIKIGRNSDLSIQSHEAASSPTPSTSTSQELPGDFHSDANPNKPH